MREKIGYFLIGVSVVSIINAFYIPWDTEYGTPEYRTARKRAIPYLVVGLIFFTIGYLMVKL